MTNDDSPLILGLDTATTQRSVVVMQGSRVLAHSAGAEEPTHAAHLLTEIDATLRAAALKLDRIGLFAATTGPGSFTGLRAGLATFQAFAAVVRHAAVVGVPTLHAVAYAAGAGERVLASIPAGRGEVFAQLLSVTPEGEIIERDAARHVTPLRLLDDAVKLKVSLTWAGTGAFGLKDLIRAKGWEENIRVPENPGAAPVTPETAWIIARPPENLSIYVARLALKAFREGRAPEAKDLRAIYVRASDAELKEICHAPN